MPFKNAESPQGVKSFGKVSINPVTGTVSATSINAGDVQVSGQDVMDYIDAAVSTRSRGTVFLHEIITSGTHYKTPGNITVLDKTVPVVPNRLYRLESTSISINQQDNASGEYQIITDLYCGSARSWNATNTRNYNGYYNVIPPHASTLYARGSSMRVIIQLGTPGTVPWKFEQAFAWPAFTLLDMGPVTDISSVPISQYAVTAGTPTPTPTPTVTTKTYEAFYYATTSANYSVGSGARTDDFPNRLVQHSHTTVRAGFATFAGGVGTAGHSWEKLRAGNVTIEAMSLVLGEPWQNQTVEWYYSSGGIGRLYYHSATGFGDTIPARTFSREIPDWNENQIKDFSISDLIPQVRSGEFNGIALSGEGRRGQYTYHGYIPSRPKIWVRYTVTE